ncbi:hypothetical protein KVR01_012622 [Diaporthe batatas]|uniref:uncharacterized protein n=1 Tax=Diaporthe batatas TaxID=748121 RepID=UPI001D03C0B2|nr:uncharacterized protein KVR01_012622 [Diaporthe batatas]KAG8157580.1 hypothetical protein KVR01_012622 [Diaporthe batatas]
MLSRSRHIISCTKHQHGGVHNVEPYQHDEREHKVIYNDPHNLSRKHDRRGFQPRDPDDPPARLRALAATFQATKNTYGTFAFSGDTVTWADPDVARPNTAAFYVCPGKSASGENALYVNTGAYLYQTPSGCYDVDIHYYGGSTANL